MGSVRIDELETPFLYQVAARSMAHGFSVFQGDRALLVVVFKMEGAHRASSSKQDSSWRWEKPQALDDESHIGCDGAKSRRSTAGRILRQGSLRRMRQGQGQVDRAVKFYVAGALNDALLSPGEAWV
ncbi:hypothetical protein AB5N19_05114 [Seiridium cardinale]|uniref:Ribosomal protein S14 n=1 Tax=Seiridium cardinale TaxID=138064 RepID=A0ABR2XPJ2_9PEZI